MIERYSREKMRKIWTDENKYNAFLRVEVLASIAWSKLGIIPKDDAKRIEENAKIDAKRVSELEQITKHDVIAFTRALSENLGEEKKMGPFRFDIN